MSDNLRFKNFTNESPTIEMSERYNKFMELINKGYLIDEKQFQYALMFVKAFGAEDIETLEKVLNSVGVRKRVMFIKKDNVYSYNGRVFDFNMLHTLFEAARTYANMPIAYVKSGDVDPIVNEMTIELKKNPNLRIEDFIFEKEYEQGSESQGHSK